MSWQYSNNQEQKKLSVDDGWCLAGVNSNSVGRRTRGTLSNVPVNILASPAASASVAQSTVTLDSALESSPPAGSSVDEEEITKPTNGRAIIEVAPLRETMERYMRCPLCNGCVEVEFPTCCIATGTRISCTNKWCTFVDIKRPTAAHPPLPEDSGSALIERNVDYAINICYVLAHLCSGDGGREAERLLGVLGLPNSSTMEKRSFSTIENIISPQLHELAKEILTDNLHEEIQLIFDNKTDDNGVPLFELWKRKELPFALWPRVKSSADMGWQKRSSGRAYASLSGHAFFCTSKTRKPIEMQVMAKSCRICYCWKARHDTPVPAHQCTANHDGSSGAMEPLAVLEMYKRLYDDNQVVVEYIISDDDSSIRSKLKWSHAGYTANGVDIPTYLAKDGKYKKKQDHGEIPSYMPMPSFVADPSHRKKTLKGELFRMFYSKVATKKTLTKCDIYRISQNFAFMSRTLPGVDPSEYVDRGKAVVEHHFDNHQYCGEFCNRKKQTDAQRQATKKFYRCKQKDKELYESLQQLVSRFVTHEALVEIGHGFDTLVNESLNNTVSWVAPKNKTYSTTQSLRNRICIAVCINGVGTLEFYQRLFVKLDMPMPIDILHFLRKTNNIRAHKIAKTKMGAVKRKRQESFYGNLLKHQEQAKKERARRDGVAYEPGIGFEPVPKEEDDRKPPAKKQRARDMSLVRCKHCLQLGHMMRSSGKCLKNPRNPNYVPGDLNGATSQTDQDAQELDVLDCLEFDNEVFFDAVEDDCMEVNAAGEQVGLI